MAADVQRGRFQRPTRTRSGMDALFAPHNIAVIGATERVRSVGRALLENLGSFEGAVYPINPRQDSILGKRAFPTVADVDTHVELAVIATPSEVVFDVVRDCVRAGVSSAVIISAGFRECGPTGEELERKILNEARKSNLRLLGPNCLGMMIPRLKLNGTFANRIANDGNVAFLSQSGALCTAILDWSVQENIGFSAFVSVGSMVDVGWGELIDYFGDDPYTKSIVCYMESVGEARSFMSAARQASLTKPIIVLKVGHTDAAAKAAASHTGALTGSDAVLDAAFRRAGVLRVNTLDELFDMAEALAKQPRAHGPRLAIVTNAGGPGVLATDMLLSSGGRLAELSPKTIEALDAVLPKTWSGANPVDILGDADAARYTSALRAVVSDPNTDGVLVILTPQSMTDPTAVAAHLLNCAKDSNKPVIASWMGGASVAAGEAILNAEGIPTFKTPDAAAHAFSLMWQYSDHLDALYETPSFSPPARDEQRGRTEATEIVENARRDDRTLLTEIESGQLLRAYGIPVIKSRLALSDDQAVRAATEIGFPVAVKLHSKTISHKSEVGGVYLNVADATAVRSAWRAIQENVTARAGEEHFRGVTIQPMIARSGIELILGSSVDPQFGPTLIFGSGGRLVEVYKDTAIALPPLNSTLARRLMERTRIYGALKGVRCEAPVDFAAMESLLVQFSQLVMEQRAIAEIDINPLFVSSSSILALDARIILHAQKADIATPAIRPYPTQYVSAWHLGDGTPLTVRPIRPEDELLLREFQQSLSDRTVYLRYFGPRKAEQRTSHGYLSRRCCISYEREMALVAEHSATPDGTHIIGVARLTRGHNPGEAEFSVSVRDEWQGHGLGTELLRRLTAVGRDMGLKRITGIIMEENFAMKRSATKAGFALNHTDDGLVAELRL